MLQHFDTNVDRAIKTLLSSITVGSAKRIASHAKTAYKALEDLRRNCGQTTNLDVHREHVKMMTMRQTSTETASNFLRRIRRQMELSISVGCSDFDDTLSITNNSKVVNIVLQGLSWNNRIYSATIADLKTKYRSDPSSISLTTLEELFFNIDEEASLSSRRENAHYIIGETKKSRNKGKDLSNITCYNCGKKGHYANKCPDSKHNSKNAPIRYESAHIVTEEPGYCKICSEVN